MRIFAIGLGGAGCRIADMLYGQDRQFSQVSCVEAIAIDRDAATLNHLACIPPEKRIYFPPVSLQTDDISDDITADEITSLLHNLDTGDKDAIILCTGAGGTMAGVGVAILEKIRSTVIEPIFGLVTLPALEEGRSTSAKAAQDIDRLLPLVEGIIVFDNEKRAGQAAGGGNKNQATTHLKLNPLAKTGPDDEKQVTYKTINTTIARRLGLLLRAGEISDSGEIQTGEVVLDAGEILNTIRSGGFIALGYAAADTSGEKFHIGSLFHQSGAQVESGHKKAERLVDLAKEAIYENISVPCDLTSAEKALILVAGPSHAISMKGFMTIRKWIDRSIAGKEMRSGDYPVKNTRYIAVIIILAGLSNIPRVKEIRAIRDDYTLENPGWEREWHKQSFQVHDPGVSIPNPPGIQGAMTDTRNARQEKNQATIRSGAPEQGQPESIAPGSEPDHGRVKSIPFFSQHKTPSKHDKAISSGLRVPGENKGIQPMPDIGNPIQVNNEHVTIIPEIPVDTPGTGNIDRITIDEKRDPQASQNGRPEPGPPVQGSMNTDLASIVARAREDLKKMDEKQ